MDRLEKSFASATETSKLLITLFTGVIAICVTLVINESGQIVGLEPLTFVQKILLAGA
jgi:hypothetical protein